MALYSCSGNDDDRNRGRCRDRDRDRDRDDEDENENGIADQLEDNIGRVITVFTESGGCSGRGFTGLLVKVKDNDFIKLITSLPSAPRHPFGRRFDFDFDRDDRCHCERQGTLVVIPIRQIVSFVFNQI